MSKTILVATEKPFAKAAVERMKEVVAKNPDFELKLLENYTDKQALLDAVKDADGLIIRSDKVTREVLDAAKNLKVVARGGAGYDNIDLEAATEKGICVMNTPGQNSNAVSELAFGMMLNLVRHHYVGKPGTELRGKSIGIHAYGNAGKCVARLARGFGMDIYAYDPYVDKSIMEADDVTPVDSREELYSKCDFISLHIPGTKETVNSINYELLSKMKPGAALINTARKEVIDEDGLKRCLPRDRISAMDRTSPRTARMRSAPPAGTVPFSPPKKWVLRPRKPTSMPVWPPSHRSSISLKKVTKPSG